MISNGFQLAQGQHSAETGETFLQLFQLGSLGKDIAITCYIHLNSETFRHEMRLGQDVSAGNILLQTKVQNTSVTKRYFQKSTKKSDY